jgi:hypothetical protein
MLEFGRKGNCFLRNCQRNPSFFFDIFHHLPLNTLIIKNLSQRRQKANILLAAYLAAT